MLWRKISRGGWVGEPWYREMPEKASLSRDVNK